MSPAPPVLGSPDETLLARVEDSQFPTTGELADRIRPQPRRPMNRSVAPTRPRMPSDDTIPPVSPLSNATRQQRSAGHRTGPSQVSGLSGRSQPFGRAGTSQRFGLLGSFTSSRLLARNRQPPADEPTRLSPLRGAAAPSSQSPLIGKGPASPTRRGLPISSIVVLMVVLVAASALSTVVVRRMHEGDLRELETLAKRAVATAQQTGNLSDYLQARQRLAALLLKHPSHTGALAALALLQNELYFEFGSLPGTGDLSEVKAAAQSAAYVMQTETLPAAQAAQVYRSLLDGDAAHAAELAASLATATPRSDTPAGDDRNPADQGLSLGHIAAGQPDYLTAQVALFLGQPATATLRRALERTPARPQWRDRLAAALLAEGQTDAARSEVAGALRQSPGHVTSMIARTYLDGLDGSPSQRAAALAALDRWVQPGGLPLAGNQLALTCLGIAELAVLDTPPQLSRARDCLRRASTWHSPDDIILSERLAADLLRVQDNQGAEEEARAVLARAPKRGEAQLILATALLRRHEAQEALYLLPPADGLLPTPRKRVLLLRAQALLALDRTLEAQEVARQLLADAGTSKDQAEAEVAAVDAQLLLARSSLQQGELVLAQGILDALLYGRPSPAGGATLHPGASQSLEAQVLLAQALLAAHPPRRENARALLESVVVHGPELGEARLLLGRLLAEQGLLPAAREQLEAALRTTDLPETRRELAQVALYQGDVPTAKQHFDILLGREADASLQLLAARTDRLSGDPAAALHLTEQVRRSRGEIPDGPDEELLIEKARDLLALSRPAEVIPLLRSPAERARRPALPALLIRAYLADDSDANHQARDLLARLSPSFRTCPEVQLAEAELLLKENKARGAAALAGAVLARLDHLHLQGEELGLKRLAQRLAEPARD